MLRHIALTLSFLKMILITPMYLFLDIEELKKKLIFLSNSKVTLFASFLSVIYSFENIS